MIHSGGISVTLSLQLATGHQTLAAATESFYNSVLNSMKLALRARARRW